MKSVGRISILVWAVFLVLVAPPVCRAAWDITPAGDPGRNWGVALSSGVQYDDNFNGTEFDRQSGLQYTSDLTLHAKVVDQRSLLSGQYDYGIVYPSNKQLGGVNQSHNLNVSENFSVNPRLLLAVNENFVNSVQPQLVLTAAGVPPTVIIAGTYIYDSIGASVSYALTPRWNMSISGNWDIWSYDETIYATNDNHQDYSTTLSAIYSINPRTTVGVNYEYGGDVYTRAGPQNGLNAYFNTGYLSLTHQFNPKLALVLNGGYTVRDSGDGTVSTAPSAYGSLIYNYGPQDVVSLVVAESLSASGLGYNRTYNAQENTSASLQLNHRFTGKLHSSVNASFVNSTFTAELLTPQLQIKNTTPSDQAITAHWGIGYDFQKWLSTELDYDYTKLLSSEPELVAPYDRDQVTIRLILTY